MLSENFAQLNVDESGASFSFMLLAQLVLGLNAVAYISDQNQVKSLSVYEYFLLSNSNHFLIFIPFIFNFDFQLKLIRLDVKWKRLQCLFQRQALGAQVYLR